MTIPGTSYATGAQIVSETGDISRFKNAFALVSYAGLNSQVSQSGKFDSGGALSPSMARPTSGGQSGLRPAEPTSTT
ncbi:transposase [Olsenella sp. Marseille-P4559]|uniref:transposase n=1 Tax=Olsenella sp. Marseille-P4559 TaxID=2364795 RepID=UPI0013EF3B21